MDPETTTAGSNRNLWYIIGAVVIVALAVLGWMFMGNSSGTGNLGAAVGESQNTTLKNLITYQGSQKCTFSTVQGDTNSSGTIYVSNGKMRGDFVSVASGQTMNSHMIVEGSTSYMWSDAMAQGVKMSFDRMATQTGSSPQGSVDPNANVDYSCSAWSADETMFALPQGVTFQDLSNLPMPGATGTGSAGAGVSAPSAQCAACDQIPDANGKAQCKAALKCK